MLYFAVTGIRAIRARARISRSRHSAQSAGRAGSHSKCLQSAPSRVDSTHNTRLTARKFYSAHPHLRRTDIHVRACDICFCGGSRILVPGRRLSLNEIYCVARARTAQAEPDREPHTGGVAVLEYCKGGPGQASFFFFFRMRR